MLVLSSPSGAGKTTIANGLLSSERDVQMSISTTTRAIRPGEVEGRDYNFVRKDQFMNMVSSKKFLEYATVFGNYYGTPRKPVENAMNKGLDVIFDIDWQGAQQLKSNVGADGSLVSVFILPPDSNQLEIRLKQRAQDTAAVVHERMSRAADEMSHYCDYDYLIVNHNIDESVGQLRSILAAERLKVERQSGLQDFVEALRKQI
ncbi:MAG: guanylate kinase [Pseudomonadota bacterium]|nr:guanylate kinase [Pseudomonadota bacterium]